MLYCRVLASTIPLLNIWIADYRIKGFHE